jgi:hypothetical protein
MKLAIDSKFIGTVLVVLAVLLAVVLIVNALFGTGAATVAGAVSGALAVKLFDKLDYHPSEEIHFGAPLISVPWLYAAIASTAILYGSVNLFLDVFFALWPIFKPDNTCNQTVLFVGAVSGWTMFAVSGWVIGRLFPANALGLSSIAFSVLFLKTALDHQEEDFTALARCLNPADPTVTEYGTDYLVSHTLGLVLQGLLCVLAARRASRRELAKATKPTPTRSSS